ncbi:MAG: twin-arginine translocase TatA/TatE family subunit, partial [Actinomycetota bacterium]|nr:twin-arginine translocase TatA/TatE family subunit [Actinomycetota bacterium]
MVGDILQPTHLLFVLVIALLVLGPKRLPEVAKTLGKGIRDFRGAISGNSDDDTPRGYLPPDDAPGHSEATPEPEPSSTHAAAG